MSEFTKWDDFLCHYRTKGTPNGVRRFQNEDGSLTPLGRDHYGVGPPRGEGGQQQEVRSGHKRVSKMTDEELRRAIERNKLEREYRESRQGHGLLRTGLNMAKQFYEDKRADRLRKEAETARQREEKAKQKERDAERAAEKQKRDEQEAIRQKERDYELKKLDLQNKGSEITERIRKSEENKAESERKSTEARANSEATVAKYNLDYAKTRAGRKAAATALKNAKTIRQLVKPSIFGGISLKKVSQKGRDDILKTFFSQSEIEKLKLKKNR